MSARMHNAELRIKKLTIEVYGNQIKARFGSKKVRALLEAQPLLKGIEEVVKDPRQIQGIKVKIMDATFSTVRQVAAVVNTLAWQLETKVNGKKQMNAKYSGEPNITKSV